MVEECGGFGETKQQAVDLGYAEWADIGYGETEFRFLEPGIQPQTGAKDE